MHEPLSHNTVDHFRWWNHGRPNKIKEVKGQTHISFNFCYITHLILNLSDILETALARLFSAILLVFLLNSLLFVGKKILPYDSNLRLKAEIPLPLFFIGLTVPLPQNPSLPATDHLIQVDLVVGKDTISHCGAMVSNLCRDKAEGVCPSAGICVCVSNKLKTITQTNSQKPKLAKWLRCDCEMRCQF